MADPQGLLLSVLSVPLLWTVAAGFAWVGLVRHSYRTLRAQRELTAIRHAGINGLLRWAAEHHRTGEGVRAALKAGLLAFALLRLNAQWERLPGLSAREDLREVLPPLLFLGILLLLSGWSRWEGHHHPRPH